MAKTEQYDIEGASKYMEAQERFYADRPDESRLALERLLGNIKGKNILDAGCGYGKDVAHYIRRGAKAWGGDASEHMIALAKKKHPEIAQFFWHETFDDIRMPDSSLDLITSRYALQHQEKIDDAYREFHRVLKPGGSAIILVPHPIQQLFAKEERIYHKKEEITVKIYDELSVVHDFTHTVEEYLSAFMISHFELLHFSEQEATSGTHEHEFEGLPDWMLMKWRKKR